MSRASVLYLSVYVAGAFTGRGKLKVEPIRNVTGPLDPEGPPRFPGHRRADGEEGESVLVCSWAKLRQGLPQVLAQLVEDLLRRLPN